MFTRYKALADHRFQVAMVILAVIATIGVGYLLNRNVESTDNATVQCDLIDVVSEVNGVIEEINFKDDQWVDKNQQLLKIEDPLFSAQLERASAALAIAASNHKEADNSSKLTKISLDADQQKSKSSWQSNQAVLLSMDASIEEAKQELNSSAVDIEYFKENFEREKELNKKKAISDTEYKNTRRLYNAKLATHSALEAKIVKLEKLRDAERSSVFNSQKSFETMVKSKDRRIENSQISAIIARSTIAAAEAEYKLAKLNMDRTWVKAKNAGYVTNRRTSAGEYVEVGQRIASIVSCHAKPWINANFKETQVGRMHQGQKAEFTMDTYPGVTFEGVVESISSGSGSTFSVLPPENASGNFTKVVKRMPVKISFAGSKDLPLRVGSSVQVKVFIK